MSDEHITDTSEENEENEVTILDQQTNDHRGIGYTLTLVERADGGLELRGEVPGLPLAKSGAYAGYDEPLSDEQLVDWPYNDEDKQVTIEDNVADDTIWLVNNHCETAIAWTLEGARLVAGEDGEERMRQMILAGAVPQRGKE